MRGASAMKQKITASLMAVFVICAGMYLFWYDRQNEATDFLIAYVAAQPVLVLILMVFTWRSVTLSRRQVSYPVSLRANALVYLGMWLVPARLSELIKPFYFKRRSGLPQQQGWALVVKERIWDLFGFACTCLIVFSLMMGRWVNDDITTRIILLCMAAFSMLVALFALPRIIDRISFLKRFEDFAAALRGGSSQEHMIQAVTACLLWALSAMLVVIFYTQSGLPQLPLIDLIFIFLVSSLGLAITVTPAGLGTYEAALVAVLAGYGIGVADGIAFALGFRLCWMLLPSLIGVWVVMQEGGEAIQISKEAA